MSAVFGEEVSTGGVVDSSAQVAPDLPGQAQPLAAGTEGAGQEGQVVQVPDQEVDVTKLDLTQPAHLQTFRSSYDKVKFERDEAARIRDETRQELETFRANQGKGIFLDTNFPLEDFKPREALTRMMEEEPEYYEQVAADFMETHFWPDLKEQVRLIEGRPLNPNDPADAEKLDSLGAVWDSLSRRMSKGQLDGDTLYSVLEVLEGSPDLQQVILARLNGATGVVPMQPQDGVPAQAQRQWGHSQGVESAEAIATQYGLDSTDRDHAQLIQRIQSDQQARITEQTQRLREQQQNQSRFDALQRQLEEQRSNQDNLRSTSTEEAQRRATTRLNELLEGSLKTDVETRYANAIPKDRPGLLGDIQTIARVTLDSNGDYKAATAKAEKWFKQAAAAKTTTDRDRWDKAGLDALAVVSNYRASAIAAAAERLLGPPRRTTVRANQKTADLLRGNGREISGSGRAIPPIAQRQPAPPGDIQGTRDSIRARIEQAKQAGVQNLPKT